ncbi:chromatin assembly factor 1 subunit B [Aplysia californica]|uniref:Chromatin assembly factor 1 subunit B n=1 Tax=Aplysia californica TaxID=6500 RepID=A0ABM0K6B5_APLCA|nr:chromatin assembly factor 1 subunit B [Aplysia californica]
MKVITPEISWHEREPVYSIDFQPGDRAIRRIASGGVDKIVRIWQFRLDEEGKGCVEFLANLRRHTATINVVRFSKNGELLATAGDDTAIILWKLSDVPPPANNIFADEDGDEDKESWVCHKSLRGHLGDVADLCWSKDNRYLVSGSVDNSAIVWDIVKDQKVAIFNEHKSYVQGVALDPLGDLVATLSSDRSLRVFNLNSKNCVNNVSKMAPLPSSQANAKSGDSQNTAPDPKPKPFRIFHDDSLRSFFRRLEFSPDGQLLMTPAGCVELGDGKLASTSFVFSRGAFAKPAMYLPSGDKATTVVRVNPQLFHLRPAQSDCPAGDTEGSDSKQEKEWDKNKSLFCLPYRVVFAVASEDTVIIYDTQQTMPVGLLKNIHYHQISDLSWSGDGKVLVISSTDGFCTIATFEDGELGEVYTKANTDEGVSVPSTVPKGVSSKKKVVTGEDKPSETSLPFSRYTSPKEKKTEEKSIQKQSSESSSSNGNSKNETSETSSSQVADSNKSQTKSANGEVKGDTVKPDTAKTEVSEKVESLTIKDSSNKMSSESKQGGGKNPEAPKKKRAVLTTISLKK